MNTYLLYVLWSCSVGKYSKASVASQFVLGWGEETDDILEY